LGQSALVQLYTADTMVQQFALSLFPLLVAYHLFDGTQCILGFLLRAYRVTTLPMVIYGVCCWGIGLGGGYWLAFHTTDWQGAAGFWLAGGLSLVLTAACLGALLRRVIEGHSRA
jgi:MATE family multidrug resistance protein